MIDHAFVLDSYAILAHLMAEQGSNRIKEVLRKAEALDIQLYGSVINLGEVFYNLFRRFPDNKAATAFALVKSWPVSWADVDESIALSAARLKSSYPIAYADCFAAAIAKRFDAAVLTGDPEFKVLKDEINVEFIV